VDHLSALQERLWAEGKRALLAILRTSTAEAPWCVVPADHERYRNWVISRILTDTHAAMDPLYREPKNLGHCEIPDM
jgi:polyphosphate kinase 2 (PPK2 family)